MTQRSQKAKIFRLVGNLCIGGAIFFAAVIVNRLWISNYFSDRAAKEAAFELLNSWQRLPQKPVRNGSSTNTIPVSTDIKLENPVSGDAFGFLYIPRLRTEVWGIPIFEGTTNNELDKGIGHYPESALPGVEGNFSLFGHRTSHGQPFSHIENLQIGDEVIVETKDFWFIYRLKTDLIVKNDEIWVTGNNRLSALRIGSLDPYKVVTLITCEPRYSTSKRWVWWGILSSVTPHNLPPQVLKYPLP